MIGHGTPVGVKTPVLQQRKHSLQKASKYADLGRKSFVSAGNYSTDPTRLGNKDGTPTLQLAPSVRRIGYSLPDLELGWSVVLNGERKTTDFQFVVVDVYLTLIPPTWSTPKKRLAGACHICQLINSTLTIATRPIPVPSSTPGRLGARTHAVRQVHTAAVARRTRFGTQYLYSRSTYSAPAIHLGRRHLTGPPQRRRPIRHIVRGPD